MNSSLTAPFFAELVGTAILVLLGDGVVANVLLKNTKGNNSGWIVITMGWAMAVFVGALIASSSSGAHLNPAITLSMAAAGKFPWSSVPAYVLAQLIGACLGAFLVWLQYKAHFDITEDGDTKLAVFCTGPQIRGAFSNFISEILGTFVLVFAALHISSPKGGLGSLDVFPVALVVLGIGLSLGGTTGYAINPARDFGPRLMHALLPIPKKRSSDWAYAWVPVAGPIAGGLLAVVVYKILEGLAGSQSDTLERPLPDKFVRQGSSCMPTLYSFELVLMVVFAIFFYRAGEEENSSGLLWSIASVAISLLVWLWLRWGFVGMIFGQVGLFVAIGVVRVIRKS